MVVAPSRISITGFLIHALYAQGKFTDVDTVLMVLGIYAGIMDGYVSWREGAVKAAFTRAAAAFVVAAIGLAGCAAGHGY
ncbi:hypothetical protein QQS21_004632 [Conoideocrella luteorostrata]|uniref:Uncharacterized protein n=1 Tax=Conoideocrella luteorostrata TaxID=1105319 RepID=A0AAJ0CS16_9HYPO|nr:hypothetical protein QQS21_004632 [Conoideocrella luteorostrata]